MKIYLPLRILKGILLGNSGNTKGASLFSLLRAYNDTSYVLHCGNYSIVVVICQANCVFFVKNMFFCEFFCRKFVDWNDKLGFRGGDNHELVIRARSFGRFGSLKDDAPVCVARGVTKSRLRASFLSEVLARSEESCAADELINLAISTLTNSR